MLPKMTSSSPRRYVSASVDSKRIAMRPGKMKLTMLPLMPPVRSRIIDKLWLEDA